MKINMKTKNIILIAAVCLASLGLSSCADKLDISEHGVLNYETFYKTDEQILSADAAMYLTMQAWGFEYNVMFCKNMLTDDFTSGGAQRGDNIDLQALNEFTFDAEQSYIQNMFTTYYTLIYKANVILGHVDSLGTQTAKMARAEARTLRAWAYFDLITMWGNPPLVDHELDPSEYNRPNGTTEELWALVEGDLNAAINSGALSQKTSVGDNATWRVTKEFAEAMLGKAYLWQNKYAEAAAMFDKVVESNLYALYTGDYGDLHRVSNKHYCESLFEVNRIYDESNPWNNFSLYYLMMNWRMDKMDWPTNTPIMNTGWGFCCPTKDLYDAFVADEGENGYRLNQTMKTYDQLKSELGISIKAGGSILGEGYFMWKTRALSADRGYSNDFVYNANALWMRYAEVLLCGAEAHFMAGNTAKAADYVNRVRRRAGLGDLGSVTLDQIKTEKRLELCGEGQRFQDLLRWGEAEAKLGSNGKRYPVISANGEVKFVDCNNTSYGFKAGKSEHLPYPATETRLNSAIVQNAGY